MIRFVKALFISVFVLSFPSSANDLETARVSLASGKYDDALAQAELLDNTDALLLAAEVINTKILLGHSEDEKEDAKRAMHIAEQILALDPDSKDAKMLYAISYGFYGRSVSPLTAWRKKLPQKIRTRIDEAVAANPELANSYALYGGWHIAVATKAGVKKGKKMYGATMDDGISHFEKALAMTPDDMMINGNYIMMLYANDQEAHGEKVRQLIAHIKTLDPKNAAEKQMQDKLLEVEAKFDDPKKAKKIAEEFLRW